MKKFLAFVLFALVTLAQADEAKLSPDLRASTASTARVVVQYRNAPSPLSLKAIKKVATSAVSNLPLVRTVVADLPLNSILELSDDPNVKYISLDRSMRPTLSNAAPAVNSPDAWKFGYTGKGIAVALIDSGVSPHPDLKGGPLNSSRVVYSQSFLPSVGSAADQYGHGTHIAGLIAGNGAKSSGPK